jgi:ADP-ribosylglycohydrolase
MEASIHQRRTRALYSLDGLSIGDGFGDKLFFHMNRFQDEMLDDLFRARILPPRRWDYTDDTQMALSIIETLYLHDQIDQDYLAQSFARHFERTRGYGPAMYKLIPLLQIGQSWRTAAASLFDGQGSFGNGAAMRVAPLGAYFADDIDRVVHQATLSAEITHSHPEAIAGAIAIAVATAYASQLRETQQPVDENTFLLQILAHIPESRVRAGVEKAMTIKSNTPVWKVVVTLGNGSGVTAQDTIPFVLWCATQHLTSYEDAIWLTASGLGDIDTNCAMVGGIVAAHTTSSGIPQTWKDCREILPAWAFPGNS